MATNEQLFSLAAVRPSRRAARAHRTSPLAPYEGKHVEPPANETGGSVVAANGEIARSFAVFTGPPNKLVAPIHDRMLLILLPAGLARKRRRGGASGAADGLSGRAVPPCPVDIRVGNMRTNDAGMIAPLARLLFGVILDGAVVSDSSRSQGRQQAPGV